MKRAVKLPYVDFSTPQLRVVACEKEVELNSRSASGLYLGVHRITREEDRLALDGSGELVDAVIEMVRLDQSSLLDRMATTGKLTPALMTGVARMIAQYMAIGNMKITAFAGRSPILVIVADLNGAKRSPWLCNKLANKR
jgi:aminoglycoside phosphotransferase family enzyme